MMQYWAVRNFAMGEVRRNTRKGIPISHDDAGAVGTRGKTSVGIHRGQEIEREEKKRTECKEELYMKECN